MRRTASVLALFPILLIACEGARGLRVHAPRSQVTIFSPLDLPAPTTIRTASGAPGRDYWQQQVDYVIESELDVEANVITGSATITYVNNSPDPLDYLWLHLEQNIFRDDSLGTQLETRMRRKGKSRSGVVIDGLHSGGVDLAISVHDTLGRIDLDDPVPPDGGRFVFTIDWHFDFPTGSSMRLGRETVEQGLIYEVAQWFPAVAVYDDEYGWNTLPYLGAGEFYTNFGSYDVHLTVPRSHIVAATGVLQNPADVFTPTQIDRLEEARGSAETILIRTPEEVEDPDSRPGGEGPLTWHYLADRVRTFAWASSDAYIYDACDLDGVLVQSVYPKEALPLWSKSTQMLRAAIKGYNEKWFRYPYPEATNVNGTEGGMEYPMIIFCRARLNEKSLYGVTTHEIGHNWFPMIVSNDERRHAWMDEGFNSFINYYSYHDWFDEGTGRRGDAAAFARHMTDERNVPVATWPDRIPGGMLHRLEYDKTSVGLVLLREQILGPKRFDPAFRMYIRRWAFKSPRPRDFFRTMEDVSGVDLAWFWRGWFLETATMDQAIASVAQDRRERGVEVTLTLDSLGELVMPVALTLHYADGAAETRRLPVESWFARRRIQRTWRADAPLVRVEIDAERKFPDVDRSNNTWSSRR